MDIHLDRWTKFSLCVAMPTYNSIILLILSGSVPVLCVSRADNGTRVVLSKTSVVLPHLPVLCVSRADNGTRVVPSKTSVVLPICCLPLVSFSLICSSCLSMSTTQIEGHAYYHEIF